MYFLYDFPNVLIYNFQNLEYKISKFKVVT